MKTGVVDVGGGLRGVYAAGVLDGCLELGVRFDLCIGVSAGSANVSSYLAGQKKRNYVFYTDYPFRKEYMGLGNFLSKRSYIDLDYVYDTLSAADGENPLDYPALMRNPSELLVVASNAVTGEAVYFDKSAIRQDDYSIFKASCAIPGVCRPYEVRGVPYFDGALGDPVPVEKAFQCGCDRVVVLLTKPKDEIRSGKKDAMMARLLRRRYPLAAEQLRLRASRYNESVARAKAYEAQGRALIVAPDGTCGVDTLTRDQAALRRFYEKGCQDARRIPAFLEA